MTTIVTRWLSTATRKWVYKAKQSKNAKENKDMTEAQIKQKRATKEENDKKLFRDEREKYLILPLKF